MKGVIVSGSNTEANGDLAPSEAGEVRTRLAWHGLLSDRGGRRPRFVFSCSRPVPTDLLHRPRVNEWTDPNARASVAALEVYPRCDTLSDQMEMHQCARLAAAQAEAPPLVEANWDQYNDPELAAWAD